MIKKLLLKLLLLTTTTLLFSGNSFADTPITLYQSIAGNVNFIGTQATRRTESNTGNACAVMSADTTNVASITNIPAGATIRAAHLYWAGSYSSEAGSTQTTPDYSVIFEGGSIVADRQYTSSFNDSEKYFSGVKDVTAQVIAKRNGDYSFSGLSVNTASPHCDYSVVIAGWALVIVYEHPDEDLRVVNLFEGFQLIYGSSVTLTPNNFIVPNAPINGKHAYLTWDGDVGNSNSINGYSEGVRFNGTVLSDASNPVDNQFNSISTINGIDNNSHGVDFDLYTIDSLLSAGETSATSIYSSGGDQVHLSMEIISITNTPVSDLAINKTHIGNFYVGQNGTYTISVQNNGPNIEPGTITVTDSLPTGLSYISATGTGWSCNASGQTVTCTRAGSLGVDTSTENITLTVAISDSAAPSVTNTASVSGTNFDNISGNNSDSDTATVANNPVISLKKTTYTLSDPINGTNNPKAIPGALSEYTLTATNNGTGVADNNSIVLSDAIPANTALYVGDISGAGTGPVRFVDGTPASGLSYNFESLASSTDNLSFSNDGGVSFNYTPTPDVDGIDSAVTHIKMATLGSFLASSAAGSPNFQFLFRVRVQ